MRIKKLASNAKRHKVTIILSVLILIGFAFRFYDFGNRYGYAYDQARDVLVSRYALQHASLPITGPFASAGPFVYGPQWYWILMVFVLLTPATFIGAWVIQAFLYVLLIYLMYLIGKEIKNENLGLTLAALTAFSTGQIAQAINLTSPSMVGILAVLCVFFLIRSIKYHKTWDSFLLGFFVANAICVHFQAIGLLVFIPVSMFFNWRRIYNHLLILLGLFIPFIPLIIFDFTNNHFESTHLMQYYLHDQYKTSYEALGRRWSTYLLSFWPNLWARVSGGTPILIYILLALGAGFMIFSKKRKISSLYLSLLFCFLIVVLQLRYFRGPLFDSYITFLHPIIIILTGGIIYFILCKNKFVGGVLLAAFLICSTWLTVQDISHSSSALSNQLDQAVVSLQKQYPGRQISLYDYKYESSGVSMPLSLKLYYNNMTSQNGINLGIANSQNIKGYKTSAGGLVFYKLSGKDVKNPVWVSLSPQNVYHSIVEWYRK